MIVAWLGILKARAAFVPLDPAYPKERLAFQIEDCGTQALLVQSNVHALLTPLSPDVSVIELGLDGSAIGSKLRG
jgi:non-ribosomal peptide synthetase component F